MLESSHPPQRIVDVLSRSLQHPQMLWDNRTHWHTPATDRQTANTRQAPRGPSNSMRHCSKPTLHCSHAAPARMMTVSQSPSDPALGVGSTSKNCPLLPDQAPPKRAQRTVSRSSVEPSRLSKNRRPAERVTTMSQAYTLRGVTMSVVSRLSVMKTCAASSFAYRLQHSAAAAPPRQLSCMRWYWLSTTCTVAGALLLQTLKPDDALMACSELHAIGYTSSMRCSTPDVSTGA